MDALPLGSAQRDMPATPFRIVRAHYPEFHINVETYPLLSTPQSLEVSPFLCVTQPINSSDKVGSQHCYSFKSGRIAARAIDAIWI
ncbi:MAG: hypothetical protein JO001_27280 [Alphaproteobacteria bacterium]|nr:hypothetical protein [Alphaproteobacteria bacterium]